MIGGRSLFILSSPPFGCCCCCAVFLCVNHKNMLLLSISSQIELHSVLLHSVCAKIYFILHTNNSNELPQYALICFFPLHAAAALIPSLCAKNIPPFIHSFIQERILDRQSSNFSYNFHAHCNYNFNLLSFCFVMP